jgi:lysophospholipase L1-like esterase
MHLRACVPFVLTICAAAVVAAPAQAAPKAKAKPTKVKQYYLSLGDSLSVGIQPGPANDPGHEAAIAQTDQGYRDQLYAIAKRRSRNLHLVKAGCSGATTENFLHGGINVTGKGYCTPPSVPQPYASTSTRTSQMAYARRFLRQHRGHVAFVTISIGNNDLDSCLVDGALDLACVEKGTKEIDRGLAVIGKALRRAAGRGVPIVGTTFYDPYLGLYATGGASGQSIAGASQTLAQTINTKTVIPAWRANGIKVARVDEAFGTYTPLSHLNADGVPVAVSNVCEWTWFCASAPAGPNIHPNEVGYGVMARALWSALRRR